MCIDNFASEFNRWGFSTYCWRSWGVSIANHVGGRPCTVDSSARRGRANNEQKILFQFPYAQTRR
jgi:hypothetical protein